jgi:branched-chain amino acid transport system ATP-binding protein
MTLLSVNNIEVIYDHVILVLKGVSLKCRGQDRRPAGRQRRGQDHHAEGDLQPAARRARRRHQGLDRVQGQRVDQLTPNDLVKRGVIQVMEGRHCFGHLTIEENLLTGAYTRSQSRGRARGTGEGLHLLPAPEDAPHLAGRLHLRRRAADVRHRPRADGQAGDDPARRAVDGPGAADRRGDLRDRADLNSKENVSFLLAEQNTMVALRYADFGYILENGRVVMEGDAESLRTNEDVKEFYLGVAANERKGRAQAFRVKSYRRRKRWLA